MIKKLFAYILVFVLTVTPIVSFAETIQCTDLTTEETNQISDKLLEDAVNYDTSVYEGNKAYLLQDTFAFVSGVEKLGLPSGWDVDKRGGSISGQENQDCNIDDSSETYSVTMTKQLLPHKSGKVTFETAFVMREIEKSGYSYELSGLGKTAVRFETQKNQLCIVGADGNLKPVSEYVAEEIVTIKAILDYDTSTYELYIKGKRCGIFDFAQDCEQLDRITVSTSDKETLTVVLRYIYIYINYLVYENFMCASEGIVPDDWDIKTDSVGSGIVADANQVFPDLFSFEINDKSAVDDVHLTKSFSEQKNKVAFETKFIFPEKADKVSISLRKDDKNAISLNVDKNDFVINKDKTVISDYLSQFWYHMKIVADVESQTADVYINYRKVLEGIAFENSVDGLNNISFDTSVTKKGNFRIDDVYVYCVPPLPKDYVEAPKPANPKGDLHVGMQMYSMWNEGNHLGWDWITAYPSRIPYLGTYNEGNKEAADWIIKWQVEHGIDFQINIFARAAANKNNPVKLPTRYHALYNGFFESEYRDYQKLAILYSAIYDYSLGGYDDFTNNIAPYIVEYYFKQPNYLIVDNKPVMFILADNFINIMGGMDMANKGIEYLGELCKKAGFDGVIVVPDGATNFRIRANEFAQGYVYSYGWQYDARSSKLMLQRNDELMAMGLNTVGSVTMGYGRNPWSNNEKASLFSTPETIKETFEGLISRYKDMEKEGKKPTNMIVMTCWDEYGEGHFFAPTRVHGFGYLDAVREAVTGEKIENCNELPTARAIARMDSLYYGNRRTLKYTVDAPAQDLPDVDFDEDKLEVLAEWDFENAKDTLGWKITKDVKNLRIEDGALVGECTAADPGIWIDGLKIPASKVKMVKVTTKTEGRGTGRLFYETDVDKIMGSGGRRFEIKQPVDGFATYTGYPADKARLVGNITAIRWDPIEGGYPNYTQFAVKKVQLLGYDDEEKVNKDKNKNDNKEKTNYKIKYNGSEQTPQCAPYIKNGKLYISCNKLIYDMGYKTTWSWPNKTFTVEDNGIVVTVTAGSSIINVNGVQHNMGTEAVYDYGHLMVPVRDVFEALGAQVVWNGEDNSVNIIKMDTSDTYEYLNTPDTSRPFCYMFETRDNLEGWKPNGDIGKMTLKKGMLEVKAVSDDPIMFSPSVSINADEYKYVRIKMKNPSKFTESMLLFIKGNDKVWNSAKRYDLKISNYDSEVKEYIIDLTENSEWNGTVTQVRFDPVNGRGTVYIDSIEFLKEV